MKNVVNSLLTAFSMYSILPVKSVDWNKNTMAYALCFFPFVGVFICVMFLLSSYVFVTFNMSPLLSGTTSMLIPIIITGKIHLDGLMDTGDAISSYKSVETKLEILKDPHVGAFGVISLVIYIIINLTFFIEFFQYKNDFLIIGIGYFLSRAYSAYSICNFKKAKNSGLAYIFSENSKKILVSNVNLFFIIISNITIVYLNITLGSLICIIGFLWFLMYKNISYKKFNGITGDLAGYFLCWFETIILVIIVLFNNIV